MAGSSMPYTSGAAFLLREGLADTCIEDGSAEEHSGSSGQQTECESAACTPVVEKAYSVPGCSNEQNQ